MINNIISCKFNIDTACVEIKLVEVTFIQKDVPKMSHSILHNGVNDDRINTR